MHALLVVLLAITLLYPQIGGAQSGAAVAPAAFDSTQTAGEPAAKKKKGGMFGKVKGLAKNKIVKAVAKTALCTAVPGGQMIAGALDAAETKDVAGAAGAVTGSGSCMPGLAGMAPSPGAGAAGIGAAGLGAGVPGAGLPSQPSTGMPGMAMSPEQLKQLQEQYAKMGIDPAQLEAMQQMMSGRVSAPAEEAVARPTVAANGVPPLTKEKGRLVLRQLPWNPGTGTIRPGSEPAFGLAIRDLAAGMGATSKRYKVEARVEEQGSKATNRALAHKRAAAVVAALEGQGVGHGRLVVSEGGGDKDPRIVLAETK